MIRDLIGAGQVQADADVLIVGAGTVGLVLATELAARGKRVICVESGGREQKGETHPLNKTEQTGTPYAGAEHGRFRCLGGTSTRWGGALIPFQDADLRNAGWPIDWADLAPYLPKVEALFGLPPGPYEEPEALPGSDYLLRLAKWPEFRRRNVYSLLRDKVEAVDGPEIWINATATRFSVERGRLTTVSAEATDGSNIAVCAKETVIAAGAIESTRLLLLLSQQNPGAVTGQGLGEGFHDHLSAVVADLQVTDRNALNHIVGFRFSPGGGMRNVRFELAPSSELRDSTSPGFAHIGFSETQGGFAALREIFRSAQKRRLPSGTDLARLLLDLPWLSRAIWWRYIHGRLLYPASAKLEVHVVIEQEVVSCNRITLSEVHRDTFEQPLSCIAWKIRSEDVDALVLAAENFAARWAGSQLGQLAMFVRRSKETIVQDMLSGGGIYHPGGSTRMSASSKTGIVDSRLRIFGITNATICATSVLPTGGGANPTMMLFLLAMRYVEETYNVTR